MRVALKYQASRFTELVVFHLYDLWISMEELKSKRMRSDLVQVWLLCQDGDELFGFLALARIEKVLARHANSFAVDSHMELTTSTKKNATLSKFLFERMTSVSICLSIS